MSGWRRYLNKEKLSINFSYSDKKLKENRSNQNKN